mmetsp:Transcript_110495/g.323228  ORF Transcript_110495/g.323228 Transcript_110495/m.323228 type:complete len:230 (+) Transcript_110495:686-1375(+)
MVPRALQHGPAQRLLVAKGTLVPQGKLQGVPCLVVFQLAHMVPNWILGGKHWRPEADGARLVQDRALAVDVSEGALQPPGAQHLHSQHLARPRPGGAGLPGVASSPARATPQEAAAAWPLGRLLFPAAGVGLGRHAPLLWHCLLDDLGPHGAIVPAKARALQVCLAGHGGTTAALGEGDEVQYLAISVLRGERQGHLARQAANRAWLHPRNEGNAHRSAPLASQGHPHV